MSSKKKNQNPSQTELKHVKSMQNLPLGSLMQQIGQLKKELIQIKQSKRKESHPNHRNAESGVSLKDNTKTRQSTVADLSVIGNNECRCKLELELQKLLRQLQGLQSKVGENWSKSINEITRLFCEQLNEQTAQKDKLRSELATLISEKQQQLIEQDEKFAVLVRNNKKLEREVEELRNKVAEKYRERDNREEELFSHYESYTQVIQQLKREIKELTKANVQLQSLVEEWELQCRQLQQIRMANQGIINSKQEQISAFQEDIQYLRIEAEKFKTQKKEFEKLWEKSSLELRDTKKAYQDQLAKAERERNRWMNECAFRRHESEQIQAIEAEKEMLFKQVQETRNNYTLKCRELAQKSTLLHEMQRRLISLESENFKLANQSDRLRRETGYWSSQMAQLREEVCKLNDSKGLVSKNVDKGEKRSRETKVKALNDIFSLIKSQRQEIGGQAS